MGPKNSIETEAESKQDKDIESPQQGKNDRIAVESPNSTVPTGSQGEGSRNKRAASVSPPAETRKRKRTVKSKPDGSSNDPEVKNTAQVINLEIEKANGSRRMPPGLPNPMPGTNVTRDDPSLRARLGLDWSDEQCKEFQDAIPEISLPVRPIQERVPKKDFWAIEAGTNPTVEHWIKTKPSTQGKKPKRTQDSRDTQIIEDEEWKHIVQANQSAIIRNSAGIPQACVVRDFLGDESVLDSMDVFSKAHCELFVDSRKEDGGAMCNFSYTAGLKSKREFMSCGNLNSNASKLSDQELRLHNHGLHSATTLMWNVAKKKIPSEFVDPMIKEMGRNGMPRADWNSFGKDFEPIVSVESEGQSHELSGLECGLPSACTTSRYSRKCHREDSLEDAPYVFSLSTRCTPGHGGNFYLQHLGVKIINARNTFIVHRANELHGTTCHDIDMTAQHQTREHGGFSMFLGIELHHLWQLRVNQENGVAQYDAKGRGILLPSQVEALSPRSRKRYKEMLKGREQRDKESAKNKELQINKI